MMPAVVRTYILTALQGTPDVAERLLNDLDADDPRWDIRPDPDRFSLREVVAHLADWEPIHLQRILRMQEEDNPMLPNLDEEAMALENDYAHSDPHASLEWLRGGRKNLVRQLGALADEEWTRPGFREQIGPVTIEVMAAFINAHDGYHTRQIAQWLSLADAGLQSP